jgi:outer membrane lipoprotein-sorting protein
VNARSFVLCGILLSSSGNFSATAQHVNSNTLLEQVAAKLSAITSVSYHYSRVINYDSMNYHNEEEQDGYIDFQPGNGMPFTFQAKRPDGFQVFNGSEVLYGMAAL